MHRPRRHDCCQDTNVTVVMPNRRPKYRQILRQALLRQSRHDTSRAKTRDLQSKVGADRHNLPLPGVLQKRRFRRLRIDDHIGTKPPHVKISIRMAQLPAKCKGRQYMDRRLVENAEESSPVLSPARIGRPGGEYCSNTDVPETRW